MTPKRAITTTGTDTLRARQLAALRGRGLAKAPIIPPARPAGALRAVRGAGGVDGAGATVRPSTGRTAPEAFELVIPAPADFLNSNDRMHWRPKADLTKTWRRAALVAARGARLPTGLGKVHIEIRVVKPTRRAYDAHNLTPTAKACIDGLVDYGLVPDDSNDFLLGPDMRRHEEPGPLGLIVVVRELPAVQVWTPADPS